MRASKRLSGHMILLTLATLTLTACSGVGFKESENGQNSTAGVPDPDPGVPVPGTITPKIVFSGPPCQRGTLCTFNFTLDKANPMAVDLDWTTDDTAYQTPSTPAFGEPRVHYIPVNGHVKFAPGELQKTATVQNINPTMTEIVIQIRMSKCQYGGGPIVGCANYF